MGMDQDTCNAMGIFDKLKKPFEETVNEKNTTAGYKRFFYHCDEGRMVVKIVPQYEGIYVDCCEILCCDSVSPSFIQVCKAGKKLRITPSWHAESAQCRLSTDEDEKERSVDCDDLLKAVKDFVGSPLFP